MRIAVFFTFRQIFIYHSMSRFRVDSRYKQSVSFLKKTKLLCCFVFYTNNNFIFFKNGLDNTFFSCKLIRFVVILVLQTENY